MPARPDLPNPDLLERIPLTARVVLDVGCGAAALSAAYRKRNPRARLLGIDKDPSVTDLAMERLDELATVDVEDDPLPFDVPEGIDCIVYGDILEHLRDPWAVLQRHAEALSPDGVILICIPNLEHWSFAEKLLRGTWDYTPSGLLDETHLRWFSLRSMREGLAKHGLVPCDVYARVFRPGQGLAVQPDDRAGTGSARHRYRRIRQAGRAAAICLAGAQDRATRMTIAANMLKPVGGVSHVRVVYPLRAMATDPAVATMLTSAVDAKGPADDAAAHFHPASPGAVR